MTIANQSVVDPELEDFANSLKGDTFKTMNCVKIGIVQKVDATKKTLEVQVVFKRVLGNDQIRSFPLLIDVPFVTIQGGGVAVQVPVAKGDNALVFFADRNIDAWFRSGQEGAPFDGRAHDASDGIALVGLNSLVSSLTANPTSEGRIISGNAKVGVLKDGTKSFLVQGSAEVAADTGKVRVKNATTSLITLIEGLIDVLKALTSQDPISGPIPLTAASIAALEAQKAIFEGLLTT